VPNTVLRDLRELSRDRTSLAAERSRLKNRIQKILEEANIKLGSVASDVLGKSGQAMLTAMVEGQENPQPLADLALGQFRLKIPQLVEALRGRVRGVHRFRLKQHLERVDFIDAQIAQLEAEIEKQNAPFDEAVSLLAEIPGFDRTTAWSVIAEIGIDMNQFRSADHLASWAGVCPGNNESGGKAGRLAREAAGCARSSVRVLGAHPGAKTVTSLPSSSESPLTGGASERSWPSVIPCSSSAITCSSADVISRTWGSITSISSIRKSSPAISSNG